MSTSSAPAPTLDATKASFYKVDPFALLIEGIDFPAGPTMAPGEADRLQLPLDEALVASICKYGVIRHVIARRDGEKYIVVDGRRRTMHARAASMKLQEIGQPPLRVGTDVMRGDEMALFATARVANSFAVVDSPLTNGKNCQYMMDKGASVEEIALTFGVKPVTVNDWIRLLDLAPEVQAEVVAGNITGNAGQALAVLSMADQVKALLEARATAAADGKKLTTAHVAASARAVRGQTQVLKVTPGEKVKKASDLIVELARKFAVAAHEGKASPDDGAVFMLLRKLTITITDKQFERMRIFWGKMRKPPEPVPCQLELF
jgi:ParB-like chromosome segregation protein Spo0J